MKYLHSLKKTELETLRKQICEELRRRYFNHRPPKFGNLNRTFKDQAEFAYFFAHVKNHRVRMVFFLQAYLGLRIKEACQIKNTDLDLEQRRIWIRSAKDSIPTSMFLHDQIYPLLFQYYKIAKEEIRETGYLFPSHAKTNHTTSKYPYISPDYCRKYFLDIIKQIGLDFSYGESQESYENHTTRRLQRLSTHSFRRWFIQRVHKQTGDLMLTQKLARHRNVKNTLIYLHADQEHIDQVLQDTFH